jgi:hypothetical protein
MFYANQNWKKVIFFGTFIFLLTFIKAQPIIKSFNPTHGKPGSIVEIKGSGFLHATDTMKHVFFGGVKANITRTTDTSLTVTVPQGGEAASTISVTVNKLTAYSNHKFLTNYTINKKISSAQYNNRTDIPGTNFTDQMVVADFNNDGFLDLATTSQMGGLTLDIFRNNKNGGYSRTNITSNNVNLAIAAGDLDGDGLFDLATATVTTNQDSAFVRIYKNISNSDSIRFQESAKLFVTKPIVPALFGANRLNIHIIDIDLDGKPDLIMNNSTVNINTDGINAGVFIIKNNVTNSTISNNNFATPAHIATRKPLKLLSVTDLNNDGKPDMIATGMDSNIHIFTNHITTGSSINSFTQKSHFESGVYVYVNSIAATDINGDNKTDVLLAGLSDVNEQGLYILQNTSSKGDTLSIERSFNPYKKAAIGGSALSLSIGDLTGDGKPDLIAGSMYDKNISLAENMTDSLTISVFPRNSFQARGFLSAISANTSAVFIGDLDHDGKPEIIAGGHYSQRAWSMYKYRDTIAPNQIPVISSITPLRGEAGTEITITGQNFSDIAANNTVIIGGIRAKVNSASATQLKVTAPKSSSYELTTVTVNKHTAYSKTPFLVSSNIGNPQTLQNGSFRSSNSPFFGRGARASSIYAEDLNNDNYPEIMVGMELPGLIQLLGNNGNRIDDSYRLTAIETDNNASVFATGDLNGDGQTDIVSINNNNGNASSMSVVIRSDQPTDSIFFFFFHTRIDYKTGVGATHVMIKDVNLDGKPDIIVLSATNGVFYCFLNTTYGPLQSNFTLSAPFLINTNDSKAKHFSLTDINHDGKPDIITSFRTDTIAGLNIFINKSTDSTIAFLQSEKIPVRQGSPLYTAVADVDMDGKAELFLSDALDSNIHIFKNISTIDSIRLQKAFVVSTLKGVGKFNFADIDGDGLIDLLVPFKDSNSIAIYPNLSKNDQIRFTTTPHKLASPGTPVAVYGTDLNGDGMPDIISANFGQTRTPVFYNQIKKPTIQSFQPTTAKRLDSVTVTGTNLKIVKLLQVGGVTVPFTIISDSIIRFRADKGIGSGHVFVSSPSGHDSLGGFNYISVPKINSFNPGSAYFGDTVLIKGYHFTNASAVKFGDSLAQSFQIISDTLIKAVVAGGTSGSVFIQNSNGKDSIAGFVYGLPTAVKIVSFAPSSAKRLDTITIKGSQLNTVTQLKVGGITIPFIIKSDSIIQFKADRGLQSGSIIITNSRNSDTAIGFNYIPVPRILSFSPQSAGLGDTVRIQGYHFTNTNNVRFADSAAASFTVVSDSIITAVVNYGKNGNIAVMHSNGSDSASGFLYKQPDISIIYPANSIMLSGIKGSTASKDQYQIAGRNLWGPLTISLNAPFSVASSKDTSVFSQSLTIQPINGKIDTTRIIIRLNTQNTGSFKDSIRHTSTGIATKLFPLTATICDQATGSFKPEINNITVDSSILCFRDSITLSITNGSNLTHYRWSTGDSSSTIRVRNTGNISVLVGSDPTCLSKPSNIIRLVKNSNATPLITLTNDSVITSSMANHYRWYFNNRVTQPSDTNRVLIAKKIGFYQVETSNDKICWDKSNNIPIVILPQSSTTDSVQIRTFPNPSQNGQFNVIATLERVTNVVARVTITDGNGTLLVQTNKFIFFGREIKIPVTVSSYRGAGFIRLEINGKVETRAIIIQ